MVRKQYHIKKVNSILNKKYKNINTGYINKNKSYEQIKFYDITKLYLYKDVNVNNYKIMLCYKL